MTPPNSGEREVRHCEICLRETFPNGKEGYQHNMCFRETAPHSRECWKLGYERLAAMTCLDPSLAQRILAALEEAYGFVPMAGKELQALAAELRAHMETR